MKKPILRTRQYLDYNECAKYVAKQLKIKDLRDVQGRWSNGKLDESKEYQDFWNFLVDRCDISNGTYIHIISELLDGNVDEWVAEIVNCFIEEFGEDNDYWVVW